LAVLWNAAFGICGKILGAVVILHVGGKNRRVLRRGFAKTCLDLRRNVIATYFELRQELVAWAFGSPSWGFLPSFAPLAELRSALFLPKIACRTPLGILKRSPHRVGSKFFASRQARCARTSITLSNAGYFVLSVLSILKREWNRSP
jgi:hypothetical protein